VIANQDQAAIGMAREDAIAVLDVPLDQGRSHKMVRHAGQYIGCRRSLPSLTPPNAHPQMAVLSKI
jgi:hypothetical protein